MPDEALELSTWAVHNCPEAQRNWLSERLSGIRQGSEPDLMELFSAAGRRLGSEFVQPGGVDTYSRFRAQDLARVAGLLSYVLQLTVESQELLLEDLFFRGSSDEKRAVLLALPLLEAPERYVELAVEACRTNTQTVFEAIACENPFPAAYFSELQFNQLVLKAIFMDLDVKRIANLSTRISSTLIEDLNNFRREREAALRPVPAGLSWILEKAR